MATGLGVDIHPVYQAGTNALPGVEYGWIKMADGAAVYTKTVNGVRYTADAHAALFRRLRIPFGGYEFAEVGTDGGKAFDVLWAECLRLGATGVTPGVDIEGAGWNATNAAARGKAFCDRARARGVRPAVYMDLSLLQATRPDLWPSNPVIWAPRYGAKPEAGGRYTGRYDVHQYSSTGTLPGSAGAVDWNQSYNNNHLTQGDDVNLGDPITAYHANGAAYTTTVGEVLAKLPAVLECVRPGNGWSVTDGWLSGALSNTNTRLPAIQDGLTQLGANLTAFETADAERDTQLLAAVGAVQAGDVHALADALIPLLPKSATADDVTAAIRAAFTRAAGA